MNTSLYSHLLEGDLLTHKWVLVARAKDNTHETLRCLICDFDVDVSAESGELVRAFMYDANSNYFKNMSCNSAIMVNALK